MTKNAETAKNTIQTVFDPRFLHTMPGEPGLEKKGEKNCYPGDMTMRRTTSRLREPHTLSRPDFAKAYLIWGLFLNLTLSGTPFSAESTFSRPLPIVSGGLAKVLSVLIGGPDKVRFKKSSQIRCTWAKSGLETVCGSRRREVVFNVAISRG